MKKNKLTWVSGICVVIILALAYGLSHSQDIERFPTLKLVIKPNKIEYKQGEPIYIDLYLKNFSNKQLKLFHPPDSIHNGWFSWHLLCYVKKPNGNRMLLEPNIIYTVVPIEKEDDYKDLAPGKAIEIKIRFEPLEIKDEYGEWVADNINGSIDPYKTPIEDINKYLAKMQMLGLVKRDILEDVFNLIGSYELTFQYLNDYDEIYDVDKEGNLNKTIKIPSAWTGSLIETIKIEIVK